MTGDCAGKFRSYPEGTCAYGEYDRRKRREGRLHCLLVSAFYYFHLYMNLILPPDCKNFEGGIRIYSSSRIPQCSQNTSLQAVTYFVLNGCARFPLMCLCSLSASFRNVPSLFSDTLPLFVHLAIFYVLNSFLYLQSSLIIMCIIQSLINSIRFTCYQLTLCGRNRREPATDGEIVRGAGGRMDCFILKNEEKRNKRSPLVMSSGSHSESLWK